ncbi:MAG: hypothetical protein A2W91_04955 [Bacteroidetes bacterium GWF2_38_335]|nr:MAG: hypothetical protein A2W91_04955 [Bacteroidetes bacterium GWF2_38_335]OFY79820.1 MAG: hypothetical protein A2281_10465 [Bacteroidetes bacterium RIFOXYA12_FULL_38_20]
MAYISNAQNIEWAKCYGGSDFDCATSVQQTTDGSFIIACHAGSNDGDINNNNGLRDYWILKLTEFGDTIWTKCYGGSNYDDAYSIQQTTDGGYIVGGNSRSNNGDVHGNHGLYDIWILKLNEFGDTLWSKCYGGSSEEHAESIQQTTDGGFIIAGYSGSIDGDVNENNGLSDVWILKLNEYGDALWSKSYGGSDFDYSYSIQQTTDGGYIVAGLSESNDGDVNGNHGTRDIWVLKLNEYGDTTWTRCYGGSYWEETNSIQQTSDGGYIVAGSSYSNDGDLNNNNGLSDYWILKLNEFGDTIWTKSYGGSNDDYSYSIQQTTDGGYIVAGYSNSNDGDVFGNHGNNDYWVLKLDEYGDTLWTKCYGGSGSEKTESLQKTTDGGSIIVGFSESNDGDVNGFHGYFDSWVLKIDDYTSTLVQETYKNIQIYPNPTYGMVNIKSDKVQKVEVVNLIGEVILVSQNKMIDIKNQPSGVYYIKVFNGEETITRKIIKI